MKQDLTIYLSIFCPQNGEAMSFSYAMHDNDNLEIFENTGYYPASDKNSLLSCFDLACNDLEFDIINAQSQYGIIGSVLFLTNYSAMPHIMNGNIYIEEHFKKIHNLKGTLREMEGDFTTINIQCANDNVIVIDRNYKAINLCLTNKYSKGFYSYSYGDFIAMDMASRQDFTAMIKINKWDKIFFGRDGETKKKIAFIKSIMNPIKAAGIQATLNFYNSFLNDNSKN